MNENIFLAQPEFIITDPRIERPERLAYQIDFDFMNKRHEVLLPEGKLDGKRVLDLGSCNAASGAWVLSRGADKYTGVELQAGYVSQSRKNLSQYYSEDRWAIHQLSIEDFLSSSKEKYDIVIALGVVHAFANVSWFLNTLATRSDYIVIDGTHPRIIDRSINLSDEMKHLILDSPDYVRFIENEPFIAMQRTGMSLVSKQTVLYKGYVPSMGFTMQILEENGFESVSGVNEELKKCLGNVYSPHKKFGLSFSRKSDGRSPKLGLMQNISGRNTLTTVKW